MSHAGTRLVFLSGERQTAVHVDTVWLNNAWVDQVRRPRKGIFDIVLPTY